MISLIVAHAKNRVIGRSNDLPWHLPEDLHQFKNRTSGHTVVMGRNTYSSIVARIGKPLPDRKNIVVSSSLNEVSGIIVARSLKEALSYTQDNEEVFIIGGAKLYEEALSAGYVERMYITLIDAEIEGDVYFPEYQLAEWAMIENIPSNNEALQYNFITYQRRV